MTDNLPEIFDKSPFPEVPSNPERKTKEISKKLLAIMAALPSIQKDSKNQHFGYSYISEAALKALIHPKLIEHECIFETKHRLVSIVQGVRIDKKVKIKSGDFLEIPTYTAVVETRGRLIDTASGQYLDFASIGQGIDDGDKAVSKAMTSAHKYLLLHMIMASAGKNDPEGDKKTDQSQHRFGNRKSKPAAKKALPKSKAVIDKDWKPVCPECSKPMIIQRNGTTEYYTFRAEQYAVCATCENESTGKKLCVFRNEKGDYIKADSGTYLCKHCFNKMEIMDEETGLARCSNADCDMNEKSTYLGDSTDGEKEKE